MKIINPTFEIIEDELEKLSLSKRIEKCGKVCYKSEHTITDNSDSSFINKIKKNGHNSVLEMGIISLEISSYNRNINDFLKRIPKFFKIKIINSSKIIITGSITAFRNFIKENFDLIITRQLLSYFHFKDDYSLFFNDIANSFYSLYNIKNIKTPNLSNHIHVAVKLYCSRAVSHEIVRHRPCSYLQECITGDTLVGNKNRRKTIKELYDRKNNQYGKTHNKTLNIYSVNDENKIIPNKIKDIFYKGKADVFKITTWLGYTIKCTNIHEFKTLSGKYKKLSNLNINDNIMVNGRSSAIKILDDELINMYINLQMSPIEIAEELNVNYKNVTNKLKKIGIFKKHLNDKYKWKYNKNHTKESYKNNGNNFLNKFNEPWNKNIREGEHPSVDIQAKTLRMYHHKNGSDVDSSGWKGCNVTKAGGRSRTRRYYKLKENCELCNEPAKEIHHINKDYTSYCGNSWISLCINCHKKIHHGWYIGKIVHPDKIINIEYVGVENVYDLEMETPNHNYIANGFVVHNSQRYCRYSKDQFENQITFIEPCFYDLKSKEYNIWKESCLQAEHDYLRLLETSSPQAARTILPNSCKTELIVYADLQEWQHIFNLRATNKGAEPSMREIMIPLHKEFKKRFPEFIV